MRFLLTVVCMLHLGVSYAIVESQDIMPEEFSSTEQKQRFKVLIKDLRCTVCQNQNLADSNASLAKDLRRQVLEMIQAGKSDDEIVEHLVARYGDFVLYKPPFNPSTYVLWIAPFVALIIALVTIVLLIRRRTHSVTVLSDTDKTALRAALQQDNPSRKDK